MKTKEEPRILSVEYLGGDPEIDAKGLQEGATIYFTMDNLDYEHKIGDLVVRVNFLLEEMEPEIYKGNIDKGALYLKVTEVDKYEDDEKESNISKQSKQRK